MHSIIRARIVLSVVAALAVAAPAAAQSANYAIAGGYQFLRNDGQNLKRGGFGEFEFHIGGPLSLIGQVGSSFDSIRSTETVFGVPVTVNGDMTITSYLTGARFAARRDAKVSPFVDLLAGYVHGSASGTATTTFAGRTFSSDASESSTEVGVQIGGGVNVFVTPKVGVQVSVAYLGIVFDVGVSNALRVASGVVFWF
jgi:hypothetical protein